MAEGLIIIRDNLGRYSNTPNYDRRKPVEKHYEKLEVLSVDYGVLIGKKHRTMAHCVCDCGKECYVDVCDLRSGSKTSCGCDTSQKRALSNRKNLVGQRFGRLLVVEMLYNYKPTRCRCMCDCGKEKIVIGTALTSGKTKSCGCLQSEIAAQYNKKCATGYVSPYGVEIMDEVKQNKNGVWIYNCKCPICGKIFQELPARIKNGHITSCGCARMSKGEKLVKHILDAFNVCYKMEQSFPDCKYRYRLKFDFAIYENDFIKCVLEYDGEQHYRPSNFFGGEKFYRETKIRDAIKDKYCKDHNIPLIRLPYFLLEDELKKIIINIINP